MALCSVPRCCRWLLCAGIVIMSPLALPGERQLIDILLMGRRSMMTGSIAASCHAGAFSCQLLWHGN